MRVWKYLWRTTQDIGAGGHREQGKGSSANRLVMDLSGPALVQRQGDDLLLQIKVTPGQEGQLRRIGLQTRQGLGGLKLLGGAIADDLEMYIGPWDIRSAPMFALARSDISGSSSGSGSTRSAPVDSS